MNAKAKAKAIWRAEEAAAGRVEAPRYYPKGKAAKGGAAAQGGKAGGKDNKGDANAKGRKGGKAK